MEQKYDFKDFVYLLLQGDLHWTKEVGKYNKHLIKVLRRAFEIKKSDIKRLEKTELLKQMKMSYQKLRTPISTAMEATLVLRRFPVLEEISESYLMQKELILEIYFEVFIHTFPHVLEMEFSLSDLRQFGYDEKKEPDMEKLYEDY